MNDEELEREDATPRLARVPVQQRTRTVQEMVIPRDSRRRERRIPWLSISGRWLEQAGFTPGMQTAITVRRGRLTIRPDRREASPCVRCPCGRTCRLPATP